jgi:hypothetical protein
MSSWRYRFLTTIVSALVCTDAAPTGAQESMSTAVATPTQFIIDQLTQEPVVLQSLMLVHSNKQTATAQCATWPKHVHRARCYIQSMLLKQA